MPRARLATFLFAELRPVGAQHAAPDLPRSSQALQQANELRRQGRKRRFRYRTLGVNDDVPSCWYLLAVATRHLAQPAAHAVANHGPAKCLFDAETEAAQWQSIGAHEHNEVGVGTALAGGVDRVKFTLAEQARLARKRLATLRR